MLSSTRGLLARNPEFHRLFIATIVSMLGDWFSFVAVADLVIELTGRPGTAAYFYAASVLPVFLVSPLAGVIVDRYDRRATLVWANLVRVPLALLLCVAAWQSSVALAAIAMIGLGVGAAFFDPGTSAATPNLVQTRDLAEAQALMGLVWGAMLVAGAGLGGVVADLLGKYVAFSLDAASFLISALLVRQIRRPMQERDGPLSRGHGFAEAWRYLRRDRAVRGLALAKIGVSSANGLVGLLPAFARATSASGLATGLLFAARGLGALVGPLLASRVMRRPPRRPDEAGGAVDPALRALVLVCGGSTLSYAVFYALMPLTPWFLGMLALVGCAHLGGGTQWTVSTYGLQALTPDHLRGRILSFDYGLATLAIGLSAIVAGLLADAYGVRAAVWSLTSLAAIYGVAWLSMTRALWRR
ncbi:MAG: MFS transporter [Kofleriaceae bacterium]